VTSGYTYDGENVLQELRGAARAKYVHSLGMDDSLAREDGSGGLTYYHADAFGTVVKHTDQTGAPTHEYRYDAWGNIEAGAGEPGYAFTGREWDPEVSLYYYRARYYDPKAGRFTSEDPVPVEYRRLGELNGYSYVGNNPVNRRDPSGKHYVERDDDLVLHTWCVAGHKHDMVTGAWSLCIPDIEWPCRLKCKLLVGAVLNVAELAAMRGAGKWITKIPWLSRVCGKQGFAYLICEEVCGDE
jgi:RHS repeat-associated protein